MVAHDPDLPRALFDADGDRVVATELSRGPWDPRACHGGPVAALLARAVVRLDVDAAWQISRLSVELTRPVPVGVPMGVACEVERPGRKVSLVAAVLRQGDVEVARVRALRIRATTVALTDDANRAADPPLAPPSSGRAERPTWRQGEGIAFHSHGCEHRYVEGSWADRGPVAVWIRLLHPVVPGEEPGGVERVAAAADFGNGVSGSLPIESYVFINPDLTVHLLRPPMGDWVGMRTASHYGPLGAGLAESALYDVEGRLGRSCQSLLVERL